MASDEEFKSFERFLEEVKKTEVLPDEDFWERVIIVPGNHDVRRLSAEQEEASLEPFAEFLRDMAGRGRRLSSPYSCIGEGKCVYVENADEEESPFAVHVFPDEQAVFVTLVSSAFSQKFCRETCDAIDKFEKLYAHFEAGGDAAQKHQEILEYFMSRIRLDRGGFSAGCGRRVCQALQPHARKDQCIDGYAKLAVAHHSLTNYHDCDDQPAANGEQMRSALADQGFLAYLHGHIHAAWSSRSPGEVPSGGLLQVSASVVGGACGTTERPGFNIIHVYPAARRLTLRRAELRKGNQYWLCGTQESFTCVQQSSRAAGRP